MTAAADQLAHEAARLHEARQRAIPISPLAHTCPNLSVDQAYSIQRMNMTRRLGEGSRLLGHKIGLTSAPMQQLLGVNEPDFGYIVDDMVVSVGATLPLAAFCAPRVEPEVAFLMGARLRGPGVTVDDVMAATEAFAPALEIVDSRIVDWRITLADTIADNASSAAVVLGNWVPKARAPRLSDATARLAVNGVVVGTGVGAAVMGDPAAAVAWLANALARYDIAIEAGHFVMSGSFTAAPFVARGDQASAHISGLGAVDVSFA